MLAGNPELNMAGIANIKGVSRARVTQVMNLLRLPKRLQTVPGLGSEAIDFRVASELFAPSRTLTAGDLESLHLVVRHQRRLVPTNGGVLLFGTQRGTLFPDAWIQVGRFEGTTRTRILDTRKSMSTGGVREAERG